MRALLDFAAQEGFLIEGGDVSHAYLHGNIDVPIIMEQPTDSSGTQRYPGKVCLLKKSMYGLRQAGVIWGSILVDALLTWGFQKSNIDHRVFLKSEQDMFVVILIVVDDMLFVSNSNHLLNYVKNKLGSSFDVKLFGNLRTFIGWEINHQPDGIVITQPRYTTTLLAKNGLLNANGAWTPLSSSANLTTPHFRDQMLSREEHTIYRAAVGKLLYLSVCTRPDISCPVSFLARNVHDPTTRHLNFLKRVLRYLCGTQNMDIKYRSAEEGRNGLAAFSDADWAGCTTNRKSKSGFIITWNESPILWKSVRQTIAALSSAESEYVSLSTCAKELIWVHKLLKELYVCAHIITDNTTSTLHPSLLKTPIFLYNKAAIAIANSQQLTSKSKHIQVKFHHI